ncbi:MAG: hypothetical protein A3J58_02790 [Candidatus Sungbacteria bacterium RIFCSPHIGHO2_02_FULL_52_23]|uniref:Uncharacterized protein n=1 Tax=Candidatus Sungbacteria bacterium RIFCSPHIGHO2_02_FULL_52_23 TaxID=1802274 RepID=A0A1G2KTG6_9BACT|nr:MAG: hypothetical protein A3J58_02790 [Candidatus Sungbacteria bacterium RIFCSPHIGHO2_02_FULL_52_23]
MEAIIAKPDLSKLLDKFKNKWVALSPDYKSVLSSGDTLEMTANKLKKTDREKVIFHRVLPSGFAPFSDEV